MSEQLLSRKISEIRTAINNYERLDRLVKDYKPQEWDHCLEHKSTRIPEPGRCVICEEDGIDDNENI